MVCHRKLRCVKKCFATLRLATAWHRKQCVSTLQGRGLIGCVVKLTLISCPSEETRTQRLRAYPFRPRFHELLSVNETTSREAVSESLNAKHYVRNLH